jgi:hypothetical protein
MLRLVIKVEMSCAIAQLLSYGDRLRSEHAPPPGCEVPEHLMARGLKRFPKAAFSTAIWGVLQNSEWHFGQRICSDLLAF